MKKIAFLFLVILLRGVLFAQSLSHVILAGGSNLTAFYFNTDQQVIIKITPDGRVQEWGTLITPERLGYYQGKLDPYIGRVDYYTTDADAAINGKVKSIGTFTITYYGSGYPIAQKGKIKSIGSQVFDYYPDYDNDSYKGKLKTAGAVAFNYYASFDNENFRGKLKSVSNTTITYYAAFEDKLNKGKLKSIGGFSYNWYNEFDRKEYQGAIKTGATVQKVNGIIYAIWY